MFNFLDKVLSNPAFYKQLALDDELVTEFNCPLDTHKESIWTSQDYFVYVIEGKKVWHIPGSSFELTQGTCIFVRKGAHIIEQFFDTRFCVVVFFVSDAFIKETLRKHRAAGKMAGANPEFPAVMRIDGDDTLHAFFNSVAPYFLNNLEADKMLLELKFRELILNVAGNPFNREVCAYFNSLVAGDQGTDLRRIMEENFQYNLRLEEFARMCGRSLSAFKRDFEKQFNNTPGRWLLDKRLQMAEVKIRSTSFTLSEIAYDCGFENLSHFSRTFKQRYGYSPKSQRKVTS